MVKGKSGIASKSESSPQCFFSRSRELIFCTTLPQLRLYRLLTSNESWTQALRAADVIFVATHSQGSIVSTHLIHKLLQDGYIHTRNNLEPTGEAFAVGTAGIASGVGGVVNAQNLREQKVACLSLCGIHLGPLAYLQKNSFLMPYIQVRAPGMILRDSG